MGKDHPPEKFVNDQKFCIFSHFALGGAAGILGILSKDTGDGGEFPIPYFFTGIVLAFLHVICAFAKLNITCEVAKKGKLTKKDILTQLQANGCGKAVWPFSCRIGSLWCIGSAILTGLSGVNCYIDENPVYDEITNKTESIDRNTCYYDIHDDRGQTHRGMAIALLVIIIVSFSYFMLSGCPVKTVEDEIKDDYAPSAVASSAATAATPATPETPATQPPPTTTTTTTTIPSLPPISGPTSSARVGPCDPVTERERHVLEREKELTMRINAIEERESIVREREAEVHRNLNRINSMPPPPSYEEIIAGTDNPPFYGQHGGEASPYNPPGIQLAYISSNPNNHTVVNMPTVSSSRS